MAYELSGSIEAGNVVATRVLARTDTGTFGGSISPDGTMVAVRSARRFGRGGIVDQGVDIWHSSSTGWNEVASVDTDAIARGVMWLTNNEFLVVANEFLYSFKSGSSGWTQAYKNSTAISDSQRIYPNADGTKLAIAGQVFDSNDPQNTTLSTRFVAFMTSGSEGYTNSSSETLAPTEVPPIADMTWVDNSNILLGFPGTNSGTGQVRHYQSGSGGWSLVGFINGATSTDGFRYFGSMVHYHAGSSTMMIGGAGATGASSTALKGYINLIPSGSSSLLPNNNLGDIVGTNGYQKVDLGAQGLTADSSAQTEGDAPYHLDGNTLSVDPTNADRFVVASAVVSDSNQNGRVLITAESGSSGWKFNQLNPEGDGLMKPYPFHGWGHQLSAGATRYVSTLTGSVDTDTTEGFTVYATGITTSSSEEGQGESSSSSSSSSSSGSGPSVPAPQRTNSSSTSGGRNKKMSAGETSFAPRKLHFEPSTIETIDKSVLNYLYGLDLFSDTNEGWKKVPVVWGTAERAFQVKNNKDIRDAQGMLKLPIISVRRTSLTKDMQSKGVFQGNIADHKDEQGGSLPVSRVIYQDKTTKFASADALRLHNQSNYPRPNAKIVYRTISAPMPVNVSVMYEITLRTEYQQQMNDLILPFVTAPGTINYVRLFEGEHRYEGFIQGDFSNGDNLADFSSDERKFETKISLKVVGYLVGQEDNRDKPHYSVRENAVEVKIPRERISLNEVPEHEYGAYYGLEGIKEPVILSGFPVPFFFSNVPSRSNIGTTEAAASEPLTSANIVTKTNFVEILNENIVVREVLKLETDPLPAQANVLTITGQEIKTNTESVYVNGVLQSVGTTKDYTIDGNVITFTDDLEPEDSVYVTYIRGPSS